MPYATGPEFYTERGFDRPKGITHAGALSQLAFHWIEPLLTLGSKQQLKENTAEAFPPYTDSAEVLSSEFWDSYDKSKANLKRGWFLWPKNALWRAIMRLYWKTFVVQFMWIIAESAQRVLSPVALRFWLQWLTGRQAGKPGNPLYEGWLLALALASSGFIYLLIHHQCFWVGMHMGFRMRQQIITGIYDKVLRLNSATVADFTVGKVVNLVSNDVRRFDDIGTYWVFLVIGPLELAVVFVLVSTALGILPALAGISALMLIIPFQAVLTRYIKHLRHNAARFTDERVRLTSEMLSGVLAIKMLAWESPFFDQISKLRQLEVKFSTRMARIRAMNMAVEFAITPFVSFVTFAVAHATNTSLSVPIVFYSLALLHLPKLYIATFFVRGIEVISETVVSVHRIDEFLALKEPPPVRAAEGEQQEGDGVAVAFHGSDFDWEAQMSNSAAARPGADGKMSMDENPFTMGPTLKNIRFELRRGDLLAICGEVGSGKSSILSALLGELQPMDLKEGTGVGDAPDQRPLLLGGVSYCSQVPWVVADSVKNNILFGSAMDEAYYESVLEACALRDDIHGLPAGDETELGERGINLSGGQKARVTLARAAYCRAQVVLLDDPLSAVDPHVGKHLFNKCIGNKGLMAGSTRILVTHQRQYLPFCDKVIVLRAGSIAAMGSYEEVAALGFPEAVVTDQDAGGTLQDVMPSPYTEENANVADKAGSSEQSCKDVCEESPSGGEEEGKGVTTAHGAHVTQLPTPDISAEDDYTPFADDNKTDPGDSQTDPEEKMLHNPIGEASNEVADHAVAVEEQSPRSFPDCDGEAGSSTKADGVDAQGMPPTVSQQSLVDLSSQPSRLPRTTSQAIRKSLSMVFHGRGAQGGLSTSQSAGEVKSARDTPLVGVSLADRRYLGRAQTERNMVVDDAVERRTADSGVVNRLQGMPGGVVRWVKRKVLRRQESKAEDEAQRLECEEEDAAQLRITKSGKLVAAEDKATGSVGWSVYVSYCRFVGWFVCALVLCGLVLGQVAFVGSEYWLATWSKQNAQAQQDAYWVWGYAIFVAAILFISYARSAIFYESSIRAATSLHTSMLRVMLRAPLAFFHTNPSGRILNRFSKDQGIVDELLPQVLFDALQSGCGVVGAFVLVGWAAPIVLPTLLPLAVIFYLARKRYICTSREVKRLEAVTRSPVYASFSATLKGLPTIRAYGVQQRFTNTFYRQLDTNGSWWFCFIACARWVGTRLDLVSACTMLFTLILMMAVHSSVPARLAGLALTHTLNLSGVLQWMIRQSAEAENSMTSVERMCTYLTLDQEPPTVAEGGGRPPPNWPTNGSITYNNVTAAYRPGLPPVLHEVSFTIQGGTSCGVVGRTGSGKSSLMLTLFRLIDMRGGCIQLDGVDTASMGVDALRGQLSVIPQDPVLFSGTLRSNLDPWSKYDDHTLWDVLSAVQLRAHVKAAGGLASVMSDCGDNFSVGQRQLLCLARALLQDASVLALDEATANVDRGTDALIQRALRQVANGSGTRGKRRTLLVIAHRIDTILDCDSLLLLQHGRLLEQGPPQDLIQQGGQFAGMVAAAKAAGKVA